MRTYVHVFRRVKKKSSHFSKRLHRSPASLNDHSFFFHLHASLHGSIYVLCLKQNPEIHASGGMRGHVNLVHCARRVG